MLAENVIEQVRLSFGRALTQDTLFEDFYRILISRSPKIERMLSKADIKNQSKLLEHALTMSLLFFQQNEIALQTVSRVRETHNRDHMNIKPGLYDVWLESLLQAISEHDPQFNDKLEQQWRQVLQVTIDYIASGYEGV